MNIDELYPEGAPRPSPARGRENLFLSVDDQADVEFFAELWTRYDRAKGLKARKWSKQRVLERFVKVGLNGLWGQAKAPRPTTASERAELLDRLVAQFKKDRKLK